MTTIQLSPQEGGIVEKILIEEGSPVKAGDAILILNNDNLDLQILNSEAELAEKENILRNTQIQMEQQKLDVRQNVLEYGTQVERLKRAYEQQKALYEDKLIAKEDYLKAEEDYRLAKQKYDLIRERSKQDSLYRGTQIDRMEESLENMQLNMQMIRKRKSNLVVKAPIDGELGLLDVVLGQSIQSGTKIGQINSVGKKQRQAHEQDSWTKLIRVLTHEIMNTVSPIASLSDAMAKSVDENGHSELDIKAGLETISDSSKNLIDFVQTYRQLSGVAKPIRRALDLQELMDSVIGLNSEFATSCGATCVYRPEEPDLMIYADEGQISQVFINLIKNALQAGAKKIVISAKMGKDDDVVVQVANDGEAIPVSAQEQIFIPFYTTKKEGSGIGLSISRQIMRNHNGSIELVRSDAQQTVFELRFR